MTISPARAHKYGDNIDTDVIIPARYCTSFHGEELGPHCLEDLDAGFVNKVKPGDVLVVGENFGCGSSRENAPIAIRAAGISAVIAKSFARIFFRNAINIGLPILETPRVVDGIQDGDPVKVDLHAQRITNLRTGDEFEALPFPPEIQEIIRVGGMIEYVKGRISRRR